MMVQAKMNLVPAPSVAGSSEKKNPSCSRLASGQMPVVVRNQTVAQQAAKSVWLWAESLRDVKTLSLYDMFLTAGLQRT